MSVIYALPVGGGILALAPLPGSEDGYAKDFEHILNWTPALVVSVATDEELASTGAKGIGARLQERATRWAHMPVAEGEVPHGVAAQAWPDISTCARRALWGGGRVLMHGRVGIGRPGMVALRLMIEAGEAPDEAQDRLRALRPAALADAAQMRWALSAEREAAVFKSRRDRGRPMAPRQVRGWKTTQAGLVTAASFRT